VQAGITASEKISTAKIVETSIFFIELSFLLYL